MKKSIFAAIAAFCGLLLLLCGCSGGKNSDTPSKPETSATSAAEPKAKTDAPQVPSTAAATETAAQPGIAENTLSAENFSMENGFVTYYENGKAASVTGVDVSSYSGDIDWERVKNAGISFVMVRLGGRGYGESGALYADDKAAEYIIGAQAAGLKTGGYFFSQAINEAEAEEEAEYCKQLLGDLKLEYPLAYDWEIIKEDEARTDNLTAEQATSCANAFFAKAKELGFAPMLYASDAEFSAKYDLTKLDDCDIWYCEYADAPHFPYRFSMWQYSKTAAVDGMEGNVDLNVCLTDIAEFLKK